MNEEILKSGRGGKREGAGRPKGTTGAYKEKKKKPCSFKLSDNEEQTTRAVLNDMRNEDLFNYNEYVRISEGFKPLILELNNKYENSLDFDIHHDSILIQTRNEKIKKEISKIIEEIIQWGRNNLDEEYFLPLINPAEIWSGISKQNITYLWLLSRVIKEDNEE